MKRVTKAEQLEMARLAFERAFDALKRQDDALELKWLAHPNPFEAAKWYCSPEQRAARWPVIEAYQRARAEYEELK